MTLIYLHGHPEVGGGHNMFYAPNFGKFEGAYCFGLVRASVLQSVLRMDTCWVLQISEIAL